MNDITSHFKGSPVEGLPVGKEKINEVENIVNEFLKYTDIADFEIKNMELNTDGSLDVGISIGDFPLRADEGGYSISVFETILRLIIKKKVENAPIIHLDINNYRGQKDDSLRELAKKAAKRARFYKTPVALEAMSSYDRRIIHAELAAHPDIKTESTGEGVNRRVVVKYIS